jgi:hypothetical protein
MHEIVWLETMNGRYLLEGVGTKGRTVLKCILNTHSLGVWPGFLLARRLVSGCWWTQENTCLFHERWHFFDQLINCSEGRLLLICYLLPVYLKFLFTIPWGPRFLKKESTGYDKPTVVIWNVLCFYISVCQFIIV